MSRGFVREGDQEEPVVIPQRAVLANHAINYVTPQGMKELRDELLDLEGAFANVTVANETEKRRTHTFIQGKIDLLKERIASARPINLIDQPQDEIRFGATVTLQNIDLKLKQTLTITGVDEADVSKGKISFTTPIAKALMGAKVSETVHFKLGEE